MLGVGRLDLAILPTAPPCRSSTCSTTTAATPSACTAMASCTGAASLRRLSPPPPTFFGWPQRFWSDNATRLHRHPGHRAGAPRCGRQPHPALQPAQQRQGRTVPPDRAPSGSPSNHRATTIHRASDPTQPVPHHLQHPTTRTGPSNDASPPTCGPHAPKSGPTDRPLSHTNQRPRQHRPRRQVPTPAATPSPSAPPTTASAPSPSSPAPTATCSSTATSSANSPSTPTNESNRSTIGADYQSPGTGHHPVRYDSRNDAMPSVQPPLPALRPPPLLLRRLPSSSLATPPRHPTQPAQPHPHTRHRLPMPSMRRPLPRRATRPDCNTF